MKKTLLVVSAFLGFGLFSNAQLMLDVAPATDMLDASMLSATIQRVDVPAPDMERVKLEDEADEKAGVLRKFTRNIPVNFNLKNSGTWELLPGGDRIWRLEVHADGAQAILPYFNDFYLPEGSRLHLYNPEKTDVLGAFTSDFNPESRLFATWYIHGESLVLEYFEPAEVAGQGSIQIGEVGYAYRDVDPELSSVRASDPCEVDVNCSEGSSWTNQRDAVCRLVVKIGGSSGYCSGAVVNNTNQDCTPYVLTALHCGITGSGTITSASDFNQWVFRFNYQNSTCAGSFPGGNNSLTGAAVVAHSNDGGGNSGSDFLLVELNNNIPSSFNVFFAGWDASGTGSSSGVGIHHPAGDVKKISTYTSALTTSGWGISGTHWRVVWASTANGHGVTEGGSSGSPIFNSSKRIIGTLTGGSSFCTSPTQPDLYGKMSYHWTSNGTANNRRLQPWLANGGSATTLDGAYAPCATSVYETELFNLVTIYPNPSEGIINVEVSDLNYQTVSIEVFNTLGQVISTGKVYAGSRLITFDLSNQDSGIYMVRVSAGNETVTKKVSVK